MKTINVKKDREVILTKVTNDMGVEHPNGIDEGYVFEGKETTKPIVGLSYCLTNKTKFFISSMVIEVLDDNTFKTLNSTYKIKYI